MQEITQEIQKDIVDTMSWDTGTIPVETVSLEIDSGLPEVKPLRVAVYLRISDRKAGKDALLRQKYHIQKWVDSMPNYKVSKVYAEKRSAKGGVKRAELNHLIRDAESHRFDVVVFWHVDRFARNVQEGLNRIKDFQSLGISVYIAGINMFWKTDDPFTTAMLQQMLIFAEFESSMCRLRTKEGIEAKVTQLAAYGEMNGIKGMRCGIPSIIEKWIKDPFPKKDKRGWAVCADTDREELFRAIWNNPEVVSAYKEIKEHFRLPVIPDCLNRCHTFKDDGTPNYKTQSELDKQTCHCGKIPSDKSIHKARVKLGLEPRKMHSWGRKKGAGWDILDSEKEVGDRIASGVGRVTTEEI